MDWRRFCVIGAASGVVAAAVFVSACGDDDDSGGSSSTPVTSLGSQKVNDHGTKDATGKTAIELEADNFYFSPTFLRGTPGQKLTLDLKNDSTTKHNLSITAAGVDKDVDSKGSVQVDVTFPESGVLMFFCKYHSTSGMVGELLAGDAKPAAAAVATAPSGGATPGSTSTADSGYTY